MKKLTNCYGFRVPLALLDLLEYLDMMDDLDPRAKLDLKADL
jgi:hypothetical protein